MHDLHAGNLETCEYVHELYMQTMQVLDSFRVCNEYAVGGAASSYAIRTKAAVLLALVTKRQGGQLLQALLPELMRLASVGATQAEMVSCHVFDALLYTSTSTFMPANFVPD